MTLLVEEYQSFPTNTKYVFHDAEKVPAPAFTVCPKPSVEYQHVSINDPNLGFVDFEIASIDWIRFIKTGMDDDDRIIENSTTVNGETIIPFVNGEYS